MCVNIWECLLLVVTLTIHPFISGDLQKNINRYLFHSIFCPGLFIFENFNDIDSLGGILSFYFWNEEIDLHRGHDLSKSCGKPRNNNPQILAFWYMWPLVLTFAVEVWQSINEKCSISVCYNGNSRGGTGAEFKYNLTHVSVKNHWQNCEEWKSQLLK